MSSGADTTSTALPAALVGAGWAPEIVLAALRMRGRPLMRIARENGYSPRSLYPVLRDRHWPRVEQLIATELSVPVQALWPERYLPDGTPRPGIRAQLRDEASST